MSCFGLASFICSILPDDPPHMLVDTATVVDSLHQTINLTLTLLCSDLSFSSVKSTCITYQLQKLMSSPGYHVNQRHLVAPPPPFPPSQVCKGNPTGQDQQDTISGLDFRHRCVMKALRRSKVSCFFRIAVHPQDEVDGHIIATRFSLNPPVQTANRKYHQKYISLIFMNRRKAPLLVFAAARRSGAEVLSQ